MEGRDEASDQRGNLVRGRVDREVTGLEDVDSGVNAPVRPAEAGHRVMRSAIGLLRNP